MCPVPTEHTAITEVAFSSSVNFHIYFCKLLSPEPGAFPGVMVWIFKTQELKSHKAQLAAYAEICTCYIKACLMCTKRF